MDNIDQKYTAKRIRDLILWRLLLATIFLSLGNVIFEVQKVNYYFLIAFVYFASIIYSIWLNLKKNLISLAVIQITVDILLVSLIVRITGGSGSVFSILYVLSILSSCIILSARAGIITAIVASLSFFCVNYGGVPVKGFEALHYYKIYVQVVTFVLIGFLFSTLTKRLSQMEKRVHLQEHLALVGEVSSQIAHEIRNPLATISGSVELLNEKIGPDLNKREQNLMEVVVDETARASEILDLFFDYAKMDTLSTEKIELHEFLDEIIGLFEQSKRLKEGIVIKKNYWSEPIEFTGDPNKLKQVFTNIIMNALDAMHEAGEIEICTHIKNPNIVITVNDTGHGIKRSKLKQLFQPFHTEKKKGLGLGLTIAEKIIRMHSGDITVKSQLHKGSSFIIILPKS